LSSVAVLIHLSRDVKKPDSDDNELLGRLKEGDAEAYTLLFNRYFEPLYRHAYHMLADRDAAYDIVQDVFAAFWDMRSELQVTSVRYYLYAAIRNGVLNEIRRSNRQEKRLEEFAAFLQTQEIPADFLVRLKQLEEEINLAITTLPPRMRQVFLLRRDEELSYAEVAERMNISKLTVKTQMNKALHLLWKRISVLFMTIIILIYLIG